MKTLTKIFTFSLLILVGSYLLFPLWSGWLISTQLPSNISLQSFESDYPGLRKISVNKIQVKFNDQIIVMNGIVIDYKLSNILIEKIFIQQDSKQASADNSIFRLPTLQVANFSLLEKFKIIQIKQFDVNNNINTYSAVQINFSRIKEGMFEVSLQVPALAKQSDAVQLLDATLQVDKKKLQLVLKKADNYLIDAVYQLTDQQIRANIKINIENIETLIPDEYFDFNSKSKGTISIDWQQDLLSNAVDVAIAVVAESQTDIIFQASQGKIKTGPIRFNLNSELRFEQLQNQLESISIKNNRLKLIASNLSFKSQDAALDIKIPKYNLEATVNNIDTAVKDIKNIDWRMTGQFSSPDIKIGYLKVIVDGVQKKNEIINIASQADIQFDLIKDDVFTTQGEMILSNLKASNSNSLLTGHMQLNWKDIQPTLSQGKILIKLNGEQGYISDLSFDSLKFESDMDVSKNKINGNGKLFINKNLLTPYSFVFNRDATELTIELQENKLAKGMFNHYLSPFGKKNNMELKITAGEVRHSGKISSADQLQVESTLDVKDMLLQFGKNTIQGLNIEQELTSVEPLKLQSTLSIKKIAFASGLDIKNIKASINSDASDNIEINSLSGEILAGKLISDKIKFDADGLRNLIMQLRQISLTELVFFMDIPGLYAEGKMDFQLPIIMDEGAIVIDGGTFEATEKGIIKYASGQTETTGDENIALKALENFHYQSLDGTMSYNKLGQYHIKLHLLGANPDLYNGYPVDFILNLQGELSGVFRSLFVTGNFEQAVMEKVKTSQLDQ